MAEGSKTKTFEFTTELKWADERYGELVLGDEKAVIRAGSPPAFKGDARNISPEDMLLSALSVCQMTTFLAYAYRTRLEFVSYHDKAHGILEIVDRKLKFTRVSLHPHVVIKNEDDRERTEKLMHDAHDGCAITNSVNFPVEMEPEITVG